MLKVALVACAAACAGAGGTALWFNSAGNHSTDLSSASVDRTLSIHQMHLNARDLTSENIKDPL